jgi:hypothetical protein
MYSYETRNPSAAIRFNFVSQWRKSQLGVGTKVERGTEKTNICIRQEPQCNKPLPMLMLPAALRRLRD